MPTTNYITLSLKAATTSYLGGIKAGTYADPTTQAATTVSVNTAGLLDVSIDCGTWS